MPPTSCRSDPESRRRFDGELARVAFRPATGERDGLEGQAFAVGLVLGPFSNGMSVHPVAFPGPSEGRGD